MKKIMTGLFTLISLVILSACGLNIVDENLSTVLKKNSSGPLDGEEYVGPLGERWQRFGGNTTIIRFEKNKIIHIEDGEEINSGTYEIDDDELIFNLGGNTLRADFLTEDHLDDKEFFTVTSADGLLGILSGVTFSKLSEEEKEYMENYELLDNSEKVEVDESSRLNGNYTGSFGLQYMESLRTMRFDGDTITAIQEDVEISSGTYKIDGDELIITMDEFTVRANLSVDREYFTVTSADGLLGVISGITFTKEEE